MVKFYYTIHDYINILVVPLQPQKFLNMDVVIVFIGAGVGAKLELVRQNFMVVSWKLLSTEWQLPKSTHVREVWGMPSGNVEF